MLQAVKFWVFWPVIQNKQHKTTEFALKYLHNPKLKILIKYFAKILLVKKSTLANWYIFAKSAVKIGQLDFDDKYIQNSKNCGVRWSDLQTSSPK
jgi:hypothetical protein